MPDLSTGGLAGRFGATQLVAMEVAALAVGAALYAAEPVLLAAIGLAVVPLLGLTLARFGGRWGYEVCSAWWRLLHRRRIGARAARTQGPNRAEWAALAPHLTIAAATDRNGTIGVGEDELGWFAAIALAPRDGLSRTEQGTLRLDWLAQLAVPASTVQVVVRAVPLPSAGLDPRTACARSYQDLRAALQVGTHREIWIAVRLGVRDGADAANQWGGDVTGVYRTLAAAMNRISAVLTGHGLDHRVLGPAELLDALSVAYGPDSYDGRLEKPAHPAHELWSRWRASRTAHVSFAVRDWPRAIGADVLTGLAQVPAAVSVNTAIVLGPSGPDRVAIRVLVRISARPDAVAASVRQVRAAARGLGLKLLRLDGEQATGVYATTPTGAAYGLN